jgi:hypothetical protein
MLTPYLQTREKRKKNGGITRWNVMRGRSENKSNFN